MQIDPAKYKSTSSAFGVVMREQGLRGFFRGWAPTFLGYSAQGAFKYGIYEVLKKKYSDLAGPEYAAKYKTLIYLAGSATAEVFADVALCPMEAVKVRVQTQPGYARGLQDGFPKIVRSEGYAGYVRVGSDTTIRAQAACFMLFRALIERVACADKLIDDVCQLSGCSEDLFLFGGDRFLVSTCIFSFRQHPYSAYDLSELSSVLRADTMMKFATYENIVEMTYKHLIPTPKDQCSKPLQLGVSFGSGYVAGVFCAAVSHPADNLVSFLNNSKGATVGDVSPHCRTQMKPTHCNCSSAGDM